MFKLETKYGNLTINPERTERLNKGVDFFNFDLHKKKSKTYYIEVLLEVDLDLRERRENLKINSNMPFSSFYYGYSDEKLSECVNKFLGDLKEFVEKPLIKSVKSNNRKNKIHFMDLERIENNFRKEIINFDDIKITIGELAEQKLKEAGVDFKRKVKELLKKQTTKTDKGIQEQIGKLISLLEKKKTLKSFKEKSETYYYFREKKDETQKFKMTRIEYNKEMEKIEKEVNKILEKLGIDNFHTSFDYLPVEKKIPYKEWLEQNKGELEMNYERYESEVDDEEREYESFDDYCEQQYNETGGVIEISWEEYKKEV